MSLVVLAIDNLKCAFFEASISPVSAFISTIPFADTSNAEALTETEKSSTNAAAAAAANRLITVDFKPFTLSQLPF